MNFIAYFRMNSLMDMVENFIHTRTRRPWDRWVRVLVFANVLLLLLSILLNIWVFRQVCPRGNTDVQNALDRNLVNSCQTIFS